MPDTSADRRIVSVSQLNRRVRQLLETHLNLLWVRGEISNLARPGSGHWYFTLKDAKGQVRCAMFRNRNNLVRQPPREGQQVVVRAHVSLYEARGDYQLIVEHLELDGEGALQAQFEALKNQLAREGLFDADHKRPIPAFPGRIGVITSPTGAAVRDILHVLKRRCPWVPVTLYPTPVQGADAAAGIVQAIEAANRHGACDVLIVGRGGGSLEDIWPFNEEIVARAIYDSHLPVISAVGHETDFTIADFVADIRAPTPSAAAELAGPDGAKLASAVADGEARLLRSLARALSNRRQRLADLRKRLRNPADRLRERAQHLDHLEIRLTRATKSALAVRRDRLQHLAEQLHAIRPQKRVQRERHNVDQLRRRLDRAMSRQLAREGERLSGLAGTLNAVSPLATLDRGYAIARDDRGGVVQSVRRVTEGQPLEILLADGALDCTVDRRRFESLTKALVKPDKGTS